MPAIKSASTLAAISDGPNAADVPAGWRYVGHAAIQSWSTNDCPGTDRAGERTIDILGKPRYRSRADLRLKIWSCRRRFGRGQAFIFRGRRTIAAVTIDSKFVARASCPCLEFNGQDAVLLFAVQRCDTLGIERDSAPGFGAFIGCPVESDDLRFARVFDLDIHSRGRLGLNIRSTRFPRSCRTLVTTTSPANVPQKLPDRGSRGGVGDGDETIGAGSRLCRTVACNRCPRVYSRFVGVAPLNGRMSVSKCVRSSHLTAEVIVPGDDFFEIHEAASTRSSDPDCRSQQSRVIPG